PAASAALRLGLRPALLLRRADRESDAAHDSPGGVAGAWRLPARHGQGCARPSHDGQGIQDPAGAPMTLTVRVAGIREEAVDVRSFELVSADGTALPAYAAGSHLDVLLKPGLTRQYSLCSAPGDSARYVIAVKREANSRGGSAAMHALKVGDTLTIGAPRNNFALFKAASHHLLIAGGIGVTPLLSMAQ